jgi:hypothetical protein
VSEPKINTWWLAPPTHEPHIDDAKKRQIRAEKRRAYNASHRDQVNAIKRAYRQRKRAELAVSRETAKGEQNGRAILTEEQVRTIIRLYGENTATQRELAHLFGVSKSTIGLIVRRERWSHVDA